MPRGPAARKRRTSSLSRSRISDAELTGAEGPPLKALRKVIPTLNLGGIRIDLAFLVLFLLTSILMGLVPA